jgi:hypothetical protein
MAATVESNIWQALKAKVNALDGDYDLDWPASDFAKPTTDAGALTPYVEVRLFPNKSNRVLITSSGPMDRMGILQLTLCVPIALKRTFEQMQEQAGLIAAQFATDERLEYGGLIVRIQQAPDIAQSFRDDAYWRWPISIRWRCAA